MSGIPLSMMRPVAGKSKGGRGDYREVSKLIEGLSSDSEQEQFSLPPLELRSPGSRGKRFKENMQSPGRSSEGCCSCKVAVCTLFLLVLCIVVAGLAVFSYRMNKDLQELKSKTSTVESGSASNPDEFQEIHRKQQELEESLTRITSGKSGVEVQAQNISQIFQQLKALDQTTKGLSKSLEAAPQLEDLPNRVDKLAEQMAEFGSQITTLKNSIETLETFQTNTEQKLADLQASKTEDGSSSREGANIPAEILQIHETLNSLTNRVDTVNDTASRKYLAVKEQVDKHSRDLGRLNTTLLDIAAQLQQLQPLPSTTSSSEVEETQAQIEQLISSAIEKLKETTATKEELQVLQNQVQNISSSLQSISNQHDSLTATSSEVTSADLQALRSDMEQCCTKCAETMKSFNSSLEDLKSKVSSSQSTDEGNEKSTKTTTVSLSTNTPGPTSEPKDNDYTSEQISSENLESVDDEGEKPHSGAKVSARDLQKEQQREVSEILKKAIEESGEH